ncbi:polyprenyl synthetase family protein [Williamsia sterculiae]|uniref:Heptaprenyl diphosphate synthase n=1 Tax=Williamsia sterculiae TaxID=1344003 RepID=A0A1N7D2Q7_9NOCA|nr:polyprenyl synthetase family protein [Williamsia sterculiae]SIR70178.1 heptaprenyl diphosphate synthase [Williamsia sterculiae]
MQTTFAGLKLGSDEFAAEIAKSLAEVEALLLRELSSGESFLTEAATHLARAGGKRFRPMFALLASHFGPHAESPDVVTSATVVELIHLATLYHDDVMDEAQMRRGAASANARWSNSVAILAGDFLFAKASGLVSTLGPESVRIVSDTFAELVTGQMRETVGAQGSADPVDHYLRVVWEKTGSLIAAAGRFGARTSGVDADDTERLSRLGDIIGTAFQISDDIIDIRSVADDSGKTPGTDLREGVHTLPVLYALRESGAAADRLREVLLTADGTAVALDDDDLVAEALELLVRSPGMTQALATLQELADQATAVLSELPQGAANTAMASLVRYTIDRVG